MSWAHRVSRVVTDTASFFKLDKTSIVPVFIVDPRSWFAVPTRTITPARLHRDHYDISVSENTLLLEQSGPVVSLLHAAFAKKTQLSIAELIRVCQFLGLQTQGSRQELLRRICLNVYSSDDAELRDKYVVDCLAVDVSSGGDTIIDPTLVDIWEQWCDPEDKKEFPSVAQGIAKIRKQERIARWQQLQHRWIQGSLRGRGRGRGRGIPKGVGKGVNAAAPAPAPPVAPAGHAAPDPLADPANRRAAGGRFVGRARVVAAAAPLQWERFACEACGCEIGRFKCNRNTMRYTIQVKTALGYVSEAPHTTSPAIATIGDGEIGVAWAREYVDFRKVCCS